MATNASFTSSPPASLPTSSSLVASSSSPSSSLVASSSSPSSTPTSSLPSSASPSSSSVPPLLQFGQRVSDLVRQAADQALELSSRVAPGLASAISSRASSAFAIDVLRRTTPVFAIALLVLCMGGTWRIAGATPPTIAEEIAAASPPAQPRVIKKSARELTGKLNLNTATEEQLMMLPTVGPAKAERIVTWRKKNGGFKRIADLRRVKGFGFKTFRRLEPFLDVKGDTTLK